MVQAKQYYFVHPSYAPGENEKWLAEKEYETTLVYMMKNKPRSTQLT